jgi:prepilin-type N-terminal cleavage/methylation domain-containing protein
MISIASQFRRNTNQWQSGFTLIELAIVLLIIGLLFVFVIPTSSVLLNTGKRELTRQKLKTIDAALTNYVTVNKRLPCPADGTVPVGNAGTEYGRDANGDCTGTAPTANQLSGIVPYVALGLTEADINDGWDRRITYRAAWGLTRDSALDMTLCDPAGTRTADTTTSAQYAAPSGRCWSTCVGTDMATCTSPQNYLANKGFDVSNGAGAALIRSRVAFTGAACVVISHGENGYGAYLRSGTKQTVGSEGIFGNIETLNQGVSVTATPPAMNATFRDTEYSPTPTAAAYFDDFLVYPSVFSVVQRAQLGPRSR